MVLVHLDDETPSQVTERMRWRFIVNYAVTSLVTLR